MKRILAIPAVIGAALTFSLTGCGNDSLSSNTGSLKVSIKAMSARSQAGSGNLSKPQVQQVTITTAKVVLGEIEIESATGDSMDFKSRAPLVANLNLGGGATDLGIVPVPFGSYEELEFEITKLTSRDSTVYSANPDLRNNSVYIRGYVDGDTNAVFIFMSNLEAEQEQEFSPPLVVDESSPQINLVLTIDTRTWFSDGAGNFLDPRVSQNRGAIERNIKASIKAFEDEDGDGEPGD